MKGKVGLSLVYIFTFALIVFLVVILIILLDTSYPKESELKFEYYTFEKYEYVKKRKTSYYEIYVEELEKPIKIHIEKKSIRKEILNEVKTGDIIKASLEEKNKYIEAYQITYNNKFILSYNDYLKDNKSNINSGIILMSIMIPIYSIVFVIEILKYKQLKEFFMA